MFPKIFASPSSTFSSPAMMFKIVDLPHPEGPTIDTICPFLMLNEISSKTLVNSTLVTNDFETFLNSTIELNFTTLDSSNILLKLTIVL